jgi:CHAT domain-containing protein/Flp pilus assembly protein TadD
LGVLGFLHYGLLAADQPQRDPVIKDPVEAVLAEGKALRLAGRFAEALSKFNRALSLARERKNTDQTVRSLMLIAAVQLLSFEYRNALATSQEALALASTERLYWLAGGASGTISSIYEQLGDFPAADAAGRQAINLLKQAPQSRAHTGEFLVRAFYGQADLCFLQGKIDEGEVFFQQAVTLAQQIGDKVLEALSWDGRGIALLRDNQFSLAEQSLNKAFAFRKAAHDENTLPVSEEHLAELELKRPRPDYAAALVLINEALSSTSVLFRTAPRYYPLHIKAKILLGSGRKLEALAEFRSAVQAAEIWRQGALPGDTTNTQTVFRLHEVYQDFAHLAAEISLERNDSGLRAEALQVLAANRAASLREQLKLALASDLKFPDSYFQKLATLQAAQARVTLGKNSETDQVNLSRIRTQVDDLENQIATQSGAKYFLTEKNLPRNPLRNIRVRLRGQQLFLSFSLGYKKSYLWAVTRDQVNLYQISGQDELEKNAVVLTKAVRDGLNSNGAADKLSDALFGVLPPRLAKKTEWIVVADGNLLNGVPFATLPLASATNGRPLLIEQHNLRFLPSELLLLSARSDSAALRFVGVADPVYNRADSRLSRLQGWEPAPVEASSVTLARLPGSGQEVRRSALQSGLQDQQILSGSQASIDNLRKVLTSPPEVLHFAVHVVSPPGRSQEAALALSLKDGLPELLTPEAIATFRVPGTLVVLSGCSSSQGKAVPGVGLLGLSRAWLLAGADAVIVSAWPTPDDSGHFFSSFYNHLHETQTGSLSQRAAFALAQTQLELQRGGGYSSSPSYWAAYSIISKE